MPCCANAADVPMYNITTAFNVEKTLAFFPTLSPEQRTIFEQLSSAALMPSAPNFEVQPPPSSPHPDASLGDVWRFNTSASSTTGTEALLLTILLAMHLPSCELDKWMLLAESDAENMNVLGEKWAPQNALVNARDVNAKCSPAHLGRLANAAFRS